MKKAQSIKENSAKAVPWWFLRREARRRKRTTVEHPVIGADKSVPVRLSQATRRPDDHVTRPAIAQANRFAALDQPKEVRKKQRKAKKPERRPLTSVQVEVKRVVRSFGAQLRHLLAEIKRVLYPPKKGGAGNRSGVGHKDCVPSISKFIKGGTLKPAVGRPFYTPPLNPRPENPKISVSGAPLTSSASSERRDDATTLVVRSGFDPIPTSPGGAGCFDYQKHQRDEQARVEWRKLSNRLVTLKYRTSTNTGAVVENYDHTAAGNLIGLYVTDFGLSNFAKYAHEIELLVPYFGFDKLVDYVSKAPKFTPIKDQLVALISNKPGSLSIK